MKLNILTPILLASALVPSSCFQKVDASQVKTHSKKTQTKGLRKNRNVAHDREERRNHLRNLEIRGAQTYQGKALKSVDKKKTEIRYVGIPTAPTTDGQNSSGAKPHALFNHDHGKSTRNNYSTRIVGGQQADPQEYPYYVDMFGCGGSLIAPRVVLSAAHCGNYEGSSVIVGGYRAATTDEGADSIMVQAQADHPAYDFSTDENDFMLLLLEEDANLGFETNIVLSLDESGIVDTLSPGDPLTVIGLGTTVEGGDLADTLREVEVPYVDDDSCRTSYGTDFADNSMHCAGTGGRDSCQGDSGGPIVLIEGDTHIQTGVVSWGIGCAAPGFPGVYSKVSSAESWIKSVVCDDWNVAASFCSGTGPTATDPPTTGAPGGCLRVDFDFHTDDWPEENDFFLVDDTENIIWEEWGFAPNVLYSYTTDCLDESRCYYLDFYDSYGDGLESGGFIRLSINGETTHELTYDIEGGVIFPIGNCPSSY